MLHSEESDEVQYTLYPAMFSGSSGGFHDTLILVSSVCSRVKLVGGDGTVTNHFKWLIK